MFLSIIILLIFLQSKNNYNSFSLFVKYVYIYH